MARDFGPDMNASRPVVACFGEALVDLLAQPASLPGVPRHFIEYAGGAPANVAAAIARLGGRARFIGMLGTDLFGDFLLAELGRFGVDVQDVQRTAAARTGLAFVALDSAGERHFSFYRPPAADLLFCAGLLRTEAFSDVAVLHVCSNSLTEAASARTTLALCQAAQAAGALVSFDVNYRPALWSAEVDPVAVMWPLLAQADIVKLCRAEAALLAAGAPGQLLPQVWSGATRLLVLTDGAAPLRWWTRRNAGDVPSFAVQAIDTTAAGDAFVGGLLHALVAQGQAFEQVLAEPALLTELLRTGAACGALATTRYGAFAAMPDARAVARLMQSAP